MSDSLHRCAWSGTDPLYVAYHDEEWGVPEYDARALWEKLVLDGFQAGLAWITILRKREGMRDAFDGFDPEKVAAYGEADIERLLGDARIIRSRATRLQRMAVVVRRRRADPEPLAR
jgi:DNA-3-methyladenine glycosylase I